MVHMNKRIQKRVMNNMKLKLKLKKERKEKTSLQSKL